MAQSPFSLDALFCREEELYNDYPTPTLTLQVFTDQDLFWENEELNSLFSKETENKLFNELGKTSNLAESRGEAIDWILNVTSYYSFSHLTAVLAVNYLDRFLCSAQLNREKPWMTQLIAVASLSLAAKVEETRVPLLLDLQVEDTTYLFEPKTIQRMEILVLSTLQWKMNPVTPISFIDHFTRRLCFKNHFCCEFLIRCQSLIVSLVSDPRFVKFLPSVLAIATMLHIIDIVDPCFKTEYQNLILSFPRINKDQLEECSKMIKTGLFGFRSNKRKLRSVIPGSPNGVVDVCFSSDSSNDSWVAAAEEAEASVSSSPEPLSKKLRVLLCEEGEDAPSFSL